MSGGILVFLITAVVPPLLLSEFGDWCPWLAARIVRWAARRLGDPASCERYEEEWIANLNEVPGKLGRLAAALGYLAYMPRMRYSVRRRAGSALPPTSAGPLALPRGIKMIGREREHEALVRLLRIAAKEMTAPQLLYVTGMPGIGKTTLVLSCAEQMKEAFPGGQLFVSSRARPSPDSLLNELLLAVGIPAAAIPKQRADKRALFRAHVSRRRVLLVLDDVTDHSSVDALSDGGLPCTILVTTRRRTIGTTTLPGRGLFLQPLSAQDGLELLRSHIGADVDAEPLAAAALIRLLESPLEIVFVANELARHPATTVTDFLHRLRTESEELDTGGKAGA